MSEVDSSLDRLHDLALPTDVSWWPLAPGWYVVTVIVLLLVIRFVGRAWKHWHANAYRRAALRELRSMDDAAGIAEVLRRTALATVPRAVVAGGTVPSWLAWLGEQCPGDMPDAVRDQLTTGIYGRASVDEDVDALRAYASFWISNHRRPPC